ncbi:MAG: Gfo/Idh/MocA family oxidoreductase [Isosphaeraceae bacterium]
MAPFRFGIVGPGFIAGVIADALARSSRARLAAVSSRSLARAEEFIADRPGVAAVEGVDALLDRPDVDAVYVATPTVAKEAIALRAIEAGKHVLVDKPYVDRASAARMIEAARSKNLVFMDATHFVHHPRNAIVRAAIPPRIGEPRSLSTNFYFPFSDRTNIRFDPKQEPMTAFGDMAWYSMRAIVEYLQPAGAVTKALLAPEIDPSTGAVVRASGLIAFEDGRVSTFDVGYTAGTILMDLELLGTSGVIGMDDFVLDWEGSHVFEGSGDRAGYFYRAGEGTRKDIAFIPTPSAASQATLMVDDFADLAASRDRDVLDAHARATLQTQGYLDALWATLGS